ncbi:MAG: hypothetical protein RIM84_09170 [Alphaproteobacteria bacterium]
MPADLVLTYGTSATLGIIGTKDNVDNRRFLFDLPVVFTMVADPFGTNVAESFARSGRANVAGTFNRVPETVNVAVAVAKKLNRYPPLAFMQIVEAVNN